jgi:hypothetical protein
MGFVNQAGMALERLLDLPCADIPYGGRGQKSLQSLTVDTATGLQGFTSFRALRPPSGFWSLLGHSGLAHKPLQQLLAVTSVSFYFFRSRAPACPAARYQFVSESLSKSIETQISPQRFNMYSNIS